MNNTLTKDTADLLHIAEIAARKAGNYLLHTLGSAKVEYQKSAKDALLDADLEAERLILTTLREEAPHIGILSEEAGHEGNHDHYWVVDPLDGSANFQHDSPLFAIAIAFVADQVTRGSIIYLPTTHEMFTAIQGQGAYLNGTPIHVSHIASLEEAMIHIGDVMKKGNAETTSERLKGVTRLALQAQRIRMIGTAATDLAYVACGRADALVNHASAPWDTEAGKLLVQEAGGKITSIQHHNSETLFIYSNSVIHQEIENLLAS